MNKPNHLHKWKIESFVGNLYVCCAQLGCDEKLPKKEAEAMLNEYETLEENIASLLRLGSFGEMNNRFARGCAFAMLLSLPLWACIITVVVLIIK